MSYPDYHVTLVLDESPEAVFDAIMDVRKWWTDELQGKTEKLDDEFSVRFADLHKTTQKLIEVEKNTKIVWLVTASELNFIKDKEEWKGTKIIFEISKNNNKTNLDFTHAGLTPQVECYSSCTKGWDHYIKGSLYKFITEGKGTPGM
jgi:uncharacterized protein YndB with AHSA1/START domain